MKPIIIYLATALFALTLSSCKKDCNGSFTIEGTLWNGTKNKPRAGVLVEAVAGKGNSLFSTGSNVKDVGSARTDENGKFKINYNCVGDDMDGISLRSSDLQYSSISAGNRLPINQNYSQFYNIPDSVSLELVLSRRNGLNPNDTLYILFGQNLKNTFSFTSSTIKEGQFAKYRFDYAYLWGINFSIPLTYSIGYESFMAKLKQPWTNDKNLSQLEPSINSLIIYY